MKARAGAAKKLALPAAALTLFIAALCLRVGLISSHKVAPDADECVVGLMAMRVERGDASQILFHGHNRGAGGGLEARLLARLYGVVSDRGAAVKGLGLAIWAALALAAAAAARRLFGGRAFWWTLLLMACAPQMASWSMKLRGGHLTSLVVLMAAVWALSASLAPGRIIPRRRVFPALGGALAVLAAWLQPLALPASAWLLAVCVYTYLRRDRKGSLASMGVAALLALTMFFAIGHGQAPNLFGPAVDPGDLALPSIKGVVSVLGGVFSVHLDYGLLGQPEQGFARTALYLLTSLVWMAFLALSVFGACAELIAGEGEAAGDDTLEDIALGAGAFPSSLYILGALGATFVFVAFAAPGWMTPRHLLAWYPLAALLMARRVAQLAEDHLAAGIFIACLLAVSGLLTGSAQWNEHRLFNPGSADGVLLGSADAAVKSLEARGVERAFTTDPEFKWNIIFASGERIKARPRNPEDGYPPYVAAVNGAVQRNLPAAVVISNPERSGRAALLERLVNERHTAAAWVAPDVVIVYGLSRPTLFHYFPLKVGAED